MKIENEVIEDKCEQYLPKLDDSIVDMIYIDPPFFTQEKRVSNDKASSKKYSFSDTWSDINSYLEWLGNCLEECHRILKKNGSIFVHCDWRANHYIRMVLDEIFGRENFRNEIIWNYRRWTNPGDFLQRTHQTIYFYAVSDKTKINNLKESYSPATNLDQIWQKRTQSEDGHSKYQENEEGVEAYDEAKEGVRMHDVWDISFLNPTAKERVGYPTQKPTELLERIIDLSTTKGDLILDPCCGSGTTLVAAKIHNRKWIGIDKSKDAIEITKKRLKNPIVSRSKVTNNGREYFREPIKEKNRHLRYLLDVIEANPIFRNKDIDGFLRDTPSEKPAGVLLISKNEDYLEKKESFIEELKRTRTPQGIIIREKNKKTIQKTFGEKSIDENLEILEFTENEVVENPKMVREELSDEIS